ncbi:MAG TPA: NmrA family NAD(P)-binding protein [Devosia sp.]|jgi:nucleoside-diphosphate-sugar epimerase
MTHVIAVAGATGNLGARIVASLRREGADVWALVRPHADAEKLGALEAGGARVIKVDLAKADELVAALRGANVVISALNGLRPVIVDGQQRLLEAAIKAGVRRFMPSDYSADFTKTADEPNRNFDLRREFASILDDAPIEAVSVLNGMFMDILAYSNPLFDLRKHSTAYWGEPDQLLDFTTMDDTASATALAALSPRAQRYVRVAGDTLDARALAQIGSEVTGKEFALVRAGSLDELSAAIEKTRQADPGGADEQFPRWQQMQYVRNMSSGKAKLEPLDNNQFPQIAWTKVRDLATRMLPR